MKFYMKTKECPSCAMDVPAKNKICPVCNHKFEKFQLWQKIVAILLLIIMMAFILLYSFQ